METVSGQEGPLGAQLPLKGEAGSTSTISPFSTQSNVQSPQRLAEPNSGSDNVSISDKLYQDSTLSEQEHTKGTNTLTPSGA